VKEFLCWKLDLTTKGLHNYLGPIDLRVQQILREKQRISRAAPSSFMFKNDDDADKLVMHICSKGDEAEDEINWLCDRFFRIAIATGRRSGDILSLPVNCIAAQHTANGPLPILVNESPDKSQSSRIGFPLLDPYIGLPAVEELILRAKNKKIPVIQNPNSGREYAHLFGLSKAPWLLSPVHLKIYLKGIKEQLDLRDDESGELINGATHGIRYRVAVIVLAETRLLEAVQAVLGHKDIRMT
jgi:integrase